MSDSPVIEFQNVSKDYVLSRWRDGGLKRALVSWRATRAERREAKRVQSLRNVTFSICRGENFGIIGPNGSGKSTTLGLIAGVLRPTSGTVRVDGRVTPLLELGAGFHWELSGRDNVILNGILLGMTRKTVLSKLDAIIDFSGLEPFIDNPLRTYSSGMMARLGFSVAVHLDPEVLLIDEVLSVGDAEFSKKCEAALERFRASDTTVVLVTHDIASMRRLCDRAVLLDRGVIISTGIARDVAAVYTNCTLPTTINA